MKTVKLSFIAAAAILLASCSSNKQEETATTDTAQVEETIDNDDYEGYDDTVAVRTPSAASEGDNTEATATKSNVDVDKMLDEYEDYMNQSIKLAKKAMNGDMSAMTEYTSLLEKAESLSKKLENYKGDMTAAQAARLQKIAAKAAQAMM